MRRPTRRCCEAFVVPSFPWCMPPKARPPPHPRGATPYKHANHQKPATGCAPGGARGAAWGATRGQLARSCRTTRRGDATPYAVTRGGTAWRCDALCRPSRWRGAPARLAQGNRPRVGAGCLSPHGLAPPARGLAAPGRGGHCLRHAPPRGAGARSGRLMNAITPRAT